MTLDAPAPSAFRGRRAEHRKPILFLVARHLAAGLDRLEDVFQLDDRGDLQVAPRAEAAAQQIVREAALRLVHVLDHQALARERFVRDEVPAQALLAIERKRRLGLLIGRQAVEKLCRRFLHRGGGFLRRDHDRAGAGGDQGGGDDKSERGEWLMEPPSAHCARCAHCAPCAPYLKVTPNPKWKRVLPVCERATSSDMLTTVR